MASLLRLELAFVAVRRARLTDDAHQVGSLLWPAARPDAAMVAAMQPQQRQSTAVGVTTEAEAAVRRKAELNGMSSASSLELDESGSSDSSMHGTIHLHPVEPSAKELAQHVVAAEPARQVAPRRPLIMVANRGEIARRVIRTCARLGVDTLAIFTSPDSLAPHVR